MSVRGRILAACVGLIVVTMLGRETQASPQRAGARPEKAAKEQAKTAQTADPGSAPLVSTSGTHTRVTKTEKDDLDVGSECRNLAPTAGPVPADLLARCAWLRPAGGDASRPLASPLTQLGPILLQETQTATMNTTSVPGIGTLTSFGAIVPSPSSDFPADVELLMGDTTHVYQLTGSGAASRYDTNGVNTPLSTVTPPSGQSWSDMATDPTTGLVYAASIVCGTTSSLSTVNLTAGTSVFIGTVTNSTCLIGIAFNNAGTLFGYDSVTDSLLSINKTNGVGMVVGPIGFDANFGQSMDCDPSSGTCYLFAFNATTFQPELRSVNLSTGATTLVGVIGATSPGGTLQAAGAVFGTIGVCTTDADCNDGNLCNGVETCVNSACSPGTPISCDDGMFCTIDTCAPATGVCSHAPNPCSDGDGCTADSCDNTNGCAHLNVCVQFCNTGNITINDASAATPYPSTINVVGLGTTASLGSVQLQGITHTFPDDIDMLLVGPGGQNAIILSDAGGSSPVVNVNLTLTDSAASPVPDGGPLVSGTFKPTNIGTGDTFPAPAPAPSGGSALSVFDGTNPNGSWKLFIVDDASIDTGSVSGGWCVNIRVNTCNTNADCSDGNFCNGIETCVNNSCVPGTPIDCSDGQVCTIDTCAPATGICSHNPDPCDDGDACTVDTCEAPAGCSHVNACAEFCNAAGVIINDSGTPPTIATPYPSTISVSGLGATGLLGAVKIRGIGHTFPDDIDVLLVGPGGQNAIIMSDVGGSGDVVGVNLTLSDGAASPIPDAGPLVSGTFKPTNAEVGDVFPAPAPAPAGGSALSVFNGTNPNGTWSLYVVDDAGVDSGTFSGGWCLSIRATCTTSAECNDNNPCTDDICVNGVCQSSSPSCDDQNPCTTDSCTGQGCQHTPNSNNCDDGNPCTSGDICSDGVCQGTPDPAPGEVTQVNFVTKQTFTWNSTPGAVSYDVLRGEIGALPVGPGGGDEQCFNDLHSLSFSDTALPSPGQGYWYLVRGENSCGGMGSYGNEEHNGVPTAPRVSATCEGGIVHPAAGSVICGQAALMAIDPDPSRPIDASTVTWEYSLNGTLYNPIPANSLPPDSRGLGGGTTLWDTSSLPSGPAFVRLSITAGADTRTWISTFFLNRPPINGPIQASFDSGSGTTTLTAPAATDPDGSIMSYQWFLGDNNILTGPAASHMYSDGNYVVFLKTTDNTGCSTLSTVQYDAPPSVPVSNLVEVDYCDPLSITVNASAQGNASNDWPADPGDGLPAGKQHLGQIHNDQLAVAYNFEVVVTVLGNPARCHEFQLIKSTKQVELMDGTRRIFKNPAAGVAGNLHADGYTAPFDWKTHTPQAGGTAQIAWLDDPRVYYVNAYGGTFNAKTNPVTKARREDEVLVEVDGGEAPIPHAETGGPGETVFERFHICMAWNAGPVISVFSVVAQGGPDAAPPVTGEVPPAPTGWLADPAGGAFPGCP